MAEVVFLIAGLARADAPRLMAAVCAVPGVGSVRLSTLQSGAHAIFVQGSLNGDTAKHIKDAIGQLHMFAIERAPRM